MFIANGIQRKWFVAFSLPTIPYCVGDTVTRSASNHFGFRGEQYLLTWPFTNVNKFHLRRHDRRLDDYARVEIALSFPES